MSGQNTSSAVMQQRSEARDALDDFPTPMWATRALLEHLIVMGHDLEELTVREPCANRGYMVKPLREYFREVLASDVHDYGAGFETYDFLFGFPRRPVDWTVMNPPFRLANQFIDRALINSDGVAAFVRTSFLEGGQRYEDLFRDNPPNQILQFCERVVIHKGAMRRAGDKYWDPDADDGVGRWRTASSATSYCWLVWLPHNDLTTPPPGTTRFDWIPPCRSIFESPDDYLPLGDL